MDAKSEIESLQSLKTLARQIYEAFPNPVWCKSLNTEIFFNAQGFHHLLFNGLGNRRSPTERKLRLNLVPFIQSAIVNGYSPTYKEDRSKNIEYWGLMAITDKIKGTRVRVVLKRVRNGKIIFWSIMPLRSINEKNAQ